MNSLPLNDFDNITAAGILARAAISLANESNPAAEFRIPNEPDLRRRLISEIGRSLGVDLENLSDSDKEKIEEELDKESEKLMEPVDESTVLTNLSAKGELPTDLYEVSIKNNSIFVSPRKFDDESRLIRFAVHTPDRVQHLLNDDDPIENPPISLFAKYFENRFSNRSFTMLVTGLRVGMCINVQQAWRIYSETVPKPSETLLDLLRRFVEEYGIAIEVNQESRKFFMNVDIPINDVTKQLQENSLIIRFCLVQLYRRNRKTKELLSSLVYAVDLDRYHRRLSTYGWEEEKMKDWAYPVGLWRLPEDARSPRTKEVDYI